MYSAQVLSRRSVRTRELPIALLFTVAVALIGVIACALGAIYFPGYAETLATIFTT